MILSREARIRLAGPQVPGALRSVPAPGQAKAERLPCLLIPPYAGEFFPIREIPDNEFSAGRLQPDAHIGVR